MSKQDKTYSRTPEDLERKYNLGRLVQGGNSKEVEELKNNISKLTESLKSLSNNPNGIITYGNYNTVGTYDYNTTVKKNDVLIVMVGHAGTTGEASGQQNYIVYAGQTIKVLCGAGYINCTVNTSSLTINEVSGNIGNGIRTIKKFISL